MFSSSGATSIELEPINPAGQELDAGGIMTNSRTVAPDEEMICVVNMEDNASSCRTFDCSARPEGTEGTQGWGPGPQRTRRKRSLLTASVAIKLTVFVGMLVTVASGVMALVFW